MPQFWIWNKVQNNPRPMIATEVFNQQAFRFAFACVLLSAALTLHVIDEALTGFLAVYNRTVRAMRKRVPLLPLPTLRSKYG